MNRVLQFLDNVIAGFLNWLYSLPPDSFKEYEVALVAYLAAIHLIDPSNQAAWVAAGFATYGIIKAIREVSMDSVTRTQIKSGAVTPVKE